VGEFRHKLRTVVTPLATNGAIQMSVHVCQTWHEIPITSIYDDSVLRDINLRSEADFTDATTTANHGSIADDPG
jgi:hypothetical protein